MSLKEFYLLNKLINLGQDQPFIAGNGCNNLSIGSGTPYFTQSYGVRKKDSTLHLSGLVSGNLLLLERKVSIDEKY